MLVYIILAIYAILATLSCILASCECAKARAEQDWILACYAQMALRLGTLEDERLELNEEQQQKKEEVKRHDHHDEYHHESDQGLPVPDPTAA